LRKFWNYVIEQSLDDYSSQIAVLLCSWQSVIGSAVAAIVPGESHVRLDVAPGQFELIEAGKFATHWLPLGGSVDLVSSETTPSGTRSDDFVDSNLTIISDVLPQLTRICERIAVDQTHAGARVEFLIVRDTAAVRPIVWQFQPLRVRSRDIISGATLWPAEDVPIGSVVLARGYLQSVQSLSDIAFVRADRSKTLLLWVDVSRVNRDRDSNIQWARALAAASDVVVVAASPLSHFVALLREYGLRVYSVVDYPSHVAGEVAVVRAERSE
jgi:hypothetical protein